MSYIVSIVPSTRPGKVLATSSDGGKSYTATQLLTGARYWLKTGADPASTITTIWSSGSEAWSLRSTIGYAASKTVRENDDEGPRFVDWTPYPSAQ
jgi:hypothetical protein